MDIAEAWRQCAGHVRTSIHGTCSSDGVDGGRRPALGFRGEDGEAATPAPLYRDPVYDGAADPVLVWNPRQRSWWLLYTQRRAKLDLPGVEWCHGTEIGVAESRDEGMTWSYLGTLDLKAMDAEYSFWAPDVIRDDGGRYHLSVSYVPGAASSHRNWGGQRHILHYSSDDLSRWVFERRVPLTSDYCIDPTLIRRRDGAWRMWYKDEGHDSKTHAVESRDLKDWIPVADPGISTLYGEGPKAFRFREQSWLIKDPNSGLDVYRPTISTRGHTKARYWTSRAGVTATAPSANTPTSSSSGIEPTSSTSPIHTPKMLRSGTACHRSPTAMRRSKPPNSRCRTDNWCAIATRRFASG
jgi:hypothetical protein